jgi:hypothetical protein
MFAAKAGRAVKEADRDSEDNPTEAPSTGMSISENAFEMPLEISWVGEEQPGVATKVSFLTLVTLTWEEALGHMHLLESKGENRVTLSRLFTNAVAARFKPAIQQKGKGKIKRVSGHIDSTVFDRVIEELQKRGWIEPAESPKYVKQRSRYWKLTETGRGVLGRKTDGKR